MLNKRWQSACRIHHAVDVCKPPESAVFKKHGAERSGKRHPCKLGAVIGLANNRQYFAPILHLFLRYVMVIKLKHSNTFTIL